MSRLRNFLYKSSLIYFPILAVLFLFRLFFPPYGINVEYSKLHWSIWEITGIISQILWVLFPIALILLLIGRSRKNNPSSPNTELRPKSRSSKWWRIGAGVSGVAFILPLIYVSILCVGSRSGSGCQDMIFLFFPLYFIVVPALVICIVGILVSDFLARGK